MTKQKTILFFVLSIGLFIFSRSFASAGENFFVDPSYDWQGRTQLNAALKKESQFAYWYFEEEYWNSLTGSDQNRITQALDEVSQEFDSVIYPRLTDLLGSVWTPGIDNDPKITILLTRLIDTAGGYFNTNDEYAKDKVQSTNQREMFYINTRFLTESRVKGFIAHELQHLITFYQKDILRNVTDEVWLNEARSEIAPQILGYENPYTGSNLQNRVSAFLSQPSDSLIEWRNNSADYGNVNIFSQYLLDRYGQDFFGETLRTTSIGIASINEALTKLGFQETFPQVFTDWTVANLINNCNVSPQHTYCYRNPDLTYGNLHITFQQEYGAGERITQVESLKDWEATWQEFSPASGITKNVLELDFVSFVKNAVFRLPTVITKNTGEVIVNFLTIAPAENGGVRGKTYIEGFGRDVSKVVVIPSNQTYVVSSDVVPISYTLTAALFNSRPVLVVPPYADGSLLRETGGEKVYVTNGRYKRWIPSSMIFEMYGHLKWKNIIEVSKDELDYYQESFLARAAGDERVYEIGNGTVKHWLNMTGEGFSFSGRNWESVFTINERERNYYYPGREVTN